MCRIFSAWAPDDAGVGLENQVVGDGRNLGFGYRSPARVPTSLLNVTEPARPRDTSQASDGSAGAALGAACAAAACAAARSDAT